MIIKVYYTNTHFTHFSNDYNNTFSVPHEGFQINWTELKHPRIKWLDNDRVELSISNKNTGNTIALSPNYNEITRIKISKFKDTDTSFANPYGNYIYFVKDVEKQLNGGCIVNLELDYWLTYFQLSPFGIAGQYLLLDSARVMIDRSHLMPEPSSWLLSQDYSYEFISNWPIYNTLLSTLERMPFDISKSVDKMIYHNQNFLMCAPAYNDTCGITTAIYPSTSNATIALDFAMPFNKSGTGKTTYRYKWAVALVYNNAGSTGFTINTSSMFDWAQALKNNFNKTTLFLVIPYNHEVYATRITSSTLEYPDFAYDSNMINGFLLVPAPTDSTAYNMYINGQLDGSGAFLIDMPLPNVLGLLNDNWNTASSDITYSTKLSLGFAVFKKYESPTGTVLKNTLLGFTIRTPDITINANYLMVGVSNDSDLRFKMIDNRYNRKPTYCTWREFLVGYTANKNITDLYLLKGLNNFYFNFKSGFIQYNFQDYEWHRNNGWNYLEFRINLFSWSFAIQTNGFIKLLNTGDNGSTWFNNATTPWFYSNATRTSNYQQWIAPLKFNNNYYEFMNTQNNSFNTSLKQMRWNHLTNLIAPSFSTAVGVGGAAYSATTGAFGKVGLLGAAGMAISGALNLGKTLVNNYFDVEKKNSFLADLNATHNGFTNAVGNYNIDVLPSMLQVVINDYMACRIWNWINKYGYNVIDTFNARHINLNNLKFNKSVIDGEVSDVAIANTGQKYGCIRFISDDIAQLNNAMINAFNGGLSETRIEQMQAKAINWMVDLMIHGISYCAMFI